jgi:hypothetical protein
VSGDLSDIVGICGLVGIATTFVGCDVGSIPTCGALEVWQWTFGSSLRTVRLVNKSAGQPQFLDVVSVMGIVIACTKASVMRNVDGDAASLSGRHGCCALTGSR